MCVPDWLAVLWVLFVAQLLYGMWLMMKDLKEYERRLGANK